jgi:isocitrate dehydrogenase kinase/phosphatase
VGAADPVRIAERILEGFEAYFTSFRSVTRRARDRFEARDWPGVIDDAALRLTLQGTLVGAVLDDLREAGVVLDASGWGGVRDAFARAVSGHPNRLIGETFFNSVVRRVLGTVGKSVATEFDAPALHVDPRAEDPEVFRTYSGHAPTATRIERILRDLGFRAPYRDVAGDARRVARRIDRYLAGILGSARIDAIDVLEPVFFRQTLAYVIGRIRVETHVLPIVLVLRHDDDGLVVDAVLLTQDELSIVFSFTRSHFQADLACVWDAVVFLKGIMPLKPVAELLIAVGFYKTGKTEMYRALRDHLATTIDRFEFARGAQGMVMLVFTLPFYGVVFKVIRDRFAYPKTATRQDVIDRYRMVFRQDRAGRMVEAQEFEKLELPRARFREDLLRDLLDEAADSVRVEGDTVVLDHVYVERKVWPLDLYVREGPAEAAPAVVVDYGNAIKDLARVNVFPGDFLLKNFGVTRHRRVVFYDYDEIGRITECRFRAIPPARNPEDELSPEPWYSVAEGDVFPEEFARFLGLPAPLASAFRDAHGDLFEPGFWRDVQRRLEDGEVLEVRPYASDKRLT